MILSVFAFLASLTNSLDLIRNRSSVKSIIFSASQTFPTIDSFGLIEIQIESLCSHKNEIQFSLFRNSIVASHENEISLL